MTKVSVIIPNYNHEDYLVQRIDSVLKQTYSDFEIIILDDCSTDNSREIIGRYKSHEKVSAVVYNEKNSGSAFAQWDKGIRLAKGEYVWIAESDDWSEPNFLETIMQGLLANKNAVIGYCQSYCINGSNTIQFQSNHPVLEEYINGKDFIKNYIIPKNPIFNAGMAVWKKDIYPQISGQFLHYKVIGDYYFWIELCLHGDVYVCGRVLNFFRTHEKSVSGNSFKNGNLFMEQIPLLQDLLASQVIDRDDFMRAMQKNYTLFRGYKKGMPEQTAGSLNELFSKAVPGTTLHWNFFRWQLKQGVKRMLSGLANAGS